MQFLVTLVQLSFLLRVIWQNVEGLAKKPTSGTLDTIWEVTGTKLPVLPVPPGHPVSKQNADVDPLFYPSYAILYFFSFLAGTSTPFFLSYIYLPKHIYPHLPLPYPNHLLSCLHHFLQYPYHIHPYLSLPCPHLLHPHLSLCPPLPSSYSSPPPSVFHFPSLPHPMLYYFPHPHHTYPCVPLTSMLPCSSFPPIYVSPSPPCSHFLSSPCPPTCSPFQLCTPP